MYIHICMVSIYVLCVYKSCRCYACCLLQNMKMNLLSYRCSGKGDEVNMRDIYAVIHLYHILRSVLVHVNNM